MNILEKLSNFKNSFEGGAPNNGFTNETLRDAVGLWVNDRDQAIRQYGDINTWNVSQVTDMNQLFRNHRNFNDDISNWDVGNVTTMQEMFSYASRFNQPLEQWNVGNVTNMLHMFYYARAFNGPLNGWERTDSTLGNVTNMEAMFMNAIAFNQPLEQWNVSNVTDMRSMFVGATAFNQPLQQWNVGKVTNMRHMFYRASAFNQPLANWERESSTIYRLVEGPDGRRGLENREREGSTVANVTNMASMFGDASAFNQPLGQWNVGSVTTMRDMFNGASAFNQPLGQWNIINVNMGDMDGMFRNATAILQRYPNADNDPRSVFTSAQTNTSNSNAFNNDTLREAVSLWIRNRDQAIEEYGDINTWNVSQVTDMNNLFYDRSDFNDDISNWDVGNVTNMQQMFYLASSFNQPIGRWNVRKVTNMKEMFCHAIAFNNGDNGNNSDNPLTWNVRKVEDMAGMFALAHSFNQPIGQWNVGNVNDMGAMFYEAYVFNQPIDQWNVGNGTNMQSMFRDATVFLQRYPDARNNPRSVFTSTETNTPNGIAFNEEPVQESDDSIIARFYNNINIISLNGRGRVTINIDRNNVFETLKQHIKSNGDDFFNKGTYIKFKGESGIDLGGLTREFFSLLTNELTKTYFIDFNGYSSIKNDFNKPKEDFNLIGKIFAYAIKTKHNLNIKLNPIVLDFLINSEEIDKIDITESIFYQLFKMFDNTTQEQSLKILEKISKENNITKRIRKDLDTLEKVKQLLNDYDINILGSSPYSSYLSLNEEKWPEFAKICLNDPGFNCMMFDNPIVVPFKYKDDFLLFIIRSFTFTQYLEEFYEFIKGFESIINLDNLKPFNLKLLNKLIIGDRTLDIDEFLNNLKIDGVEEGKKEIIKDVIREINQKNISSGIDDYLNKFLYLITGSDSLPINGWQSFTGREFRLVFTDQVSEISSHTCEDFKYVEIPNPVILGNDIKENLSNILSYDSIVESGKSKYCAAGGGIRNSLIDRLRNFLN